MLDRVACLYQHTTGVGIVEPAHMELAEPTIAQAFARCVARGARRVVVQPYFLSPGRHSTVDIPAMAAEAAAAHPGVAVVVTEALGLDPRMAEVMHRRVMEALQIKSGSRASEILPSAGRRRSAFPNGHLGTSEE